MKVAVITRHAITNYGSLLQAMATQQIIESLGHSCEIIDYIRDDEHYKQQEINIVKRKNKWNRNILLKMLYLAIRLPDSIAAGRIFEKYQRKYLNLSPRYTKYEQLVCNPPKADVYMTGSDQVWGPIQTGTYDDVYFLSFTDEKKIAYAASIGNHDINSDIKMFIKKWLSRYSYVTVREDSAVQLLKEIGIMAKQVIDPTLLVETSYWNNLLEPIKLKSKYILIYQLHNDKKLGEYAKKVASIKGLPLVRVSVSFHQIIRPGKFIWCPSVGEFLSYIKNAECIITDSYHGTLFAINFNIPFIEILPNNNTATRNISILNLTNLTERILNDENDVLLANKKIDFSYANKIIKEKRIESLCIFKEMIELKRN